ncbi:MAG TPA: acyl-CoA thioesterase [Longimicrobium sp.]|nr:acyl-CoA thioesterase [Longimicrobium sp.]
MSEPRREPADAPEPTHEAGAGVLFTCPFEVRWSDVDGNRHVRNTAFSEYATHTRFRLLAAHGFDAARLEALRFGPVMMREETRYRRELHLGDRVTVTVRCSGLSADASHWRVRQEVLREDGKEAAVLTIQGGWIHLDSRKLIVPPAGLGDILLALPRTRDFEELASLVRSR